MPNPRPIRAIRPITVAATTTVTTYPVSAAAALNVEANEDVAYILKQLGVVVPVTAKQYIAICLHFA